ncbi:tyrosine-type recombinase/integrase [Paenibacillus pini]
MKGSLNNVGILNTGTVYNDIKSFINNKSNRSNNTSKSYEKAYRLFFTLIKHKDLENLEISDIEIDLPELMDYQTILVKSGRYNNNSINQRIAALRSLYNSFKAQKKYKDFVELAIFKEVKNLPKDTKSIGILTGDESLHLAELALTEQRNGLMKKAIILIAVTTSIRKSAIFELKPKHINPDRDREHVYIISSDDLFDKGNIVDFKEIHKDVYDILTLIHGNKSENTPYFYIGMTTFDDTLKRLCVKANIDYKKRRISVHSLRKAGTQFAYEIGGLRAAQMQAGHSSPTITSLSYIKKEANLTGIGLIEKQNNIVFDELTKEEAIALLKSIGNGTGEKLKKEAKKIIESRHI